MKSVVHDKLQDDLANTPFEDICCKDVNCENESHRDELGIFYKELVGAMSAASDQLKHKRSSFNAQPGWNDYVYDSHKAARDSFVIWRGIGKPRQGYEFDMMRFSRAQFKYALRSAKQEGTLRRESLAKKLALSQPNKFWQEIRVMNGNHKSLPSCVGGVSGKDDIADVWREHFDKLFNCIQDDDVNNNNNNII